MDAQRVQGWIFLLSAMTLPMGGCDPETEPPEQDEPGGGATSTGPDAEAPPSDGSVCERVGARYM